MVIFTCSPGFCALTSGRAKLHRKCTENHSCRPVLSTESCHGAYRDQISCTVGVIMWIPTSALRNLFLGQKKDPRALYSTSCEGKVHLAQTYGEHTVRFFFNLSTQQCFPCLTLTCREPTRKKEDLTRTTPES